MYCASFLIVIANKVRYFCFFLTLTNFGLMAFELKFPFYTAGTSILSKMRWILSNFIYFIILRVFFIHVQTGVYLEHLFFVKSRAILTKQTPHTLQNLYHSDEIRLKMEGGKDSIIKIR